MKKGGDTQINEICLVSLLIRGSYKDQNACDVLNMDVGHILLGRSCATRKVGFNDIKFVT